MACNTFSATLPIAQRVTPERPWEEIITIVLDSFSASSIITEAASPCLPTTETSVPTSTSVPLTRSK